MYNLYDFLQQMTGKIYTLTNNNKSDSIQEVYWQEEPENIILIIKNGIPKFLKNQEAKNYIKIFKQIRLKNLEN